MWNRHDKFECMFCDKMNGMTTPWVRTITQRTTFFMVLVNKMWTFLQVKKENKFQLRSKKEMIVLNRRSRLMAHDGTGGVRHRNVERQWTIGKKCYRQHIILHWFSTFSIAFHLIATAQFLAVFDFVQWFILSSLNALVLLSRCLSLCDIIYIFGYQQMDRIFSTNTRLRFYKHTSPSPSLALVCETRFITRTSSLFAHWSYFDKIWRFYYLSSFLSASYRVFFSISLILVLCVSNSEYLYRDTDVTVQLTIARNSHRVK